MQSHYRLHNDVQLAHFSLRRWKNDAVALLADVATTRKSNFLPHTKRGKVADLFKECWVHCFNHWVKKTKRTNVHKWLPIFIFCLVSLIVFLWRPNKYEQYQIVNYSCRRDHNNASIPKCRCNWWSDIFVINNDKICLPCDCCIVLAIIPDAKNSSRDQRQPN